jgi:hypothetical protein
VLQEGLHGEGDGAGVRVVCRCHPGREGLLVEEPHPAYDRCRYDAPRDAGVGGWGAVGGRDLWNGRPRPSRA